MSARNGDKARFQKDRKRKLLHRQKIQALVDAVRAQKASDQASPAPADSASAAVRER